MSFAVPVLTSVEVRILSESIHYGGILNCILREVSVPLELERIKEKSCIL